MAIFIPLVTKFDDAGLRGAQRALANFNNFAVEVGRVAAAAVSAVAVSSVREATQFESSFAKIQGLVGLTEAEVESLKASARELGPQFGRSANEAADALFFITSSGLRGADATNVLEASLKGAAIGLGDITDLANAATASVNTFGSDVLSGTQAVDAIAEAVRLGQFAPEELAGSLGRVLPISSELGISLQETLGLVAGLTRGGLNAAESVTGLRGAYQAFLKPSAEAAETLAQYGFSVEDVRESIVQKGFLATMVDLRTAFGDNDDAVTRVFGSIEGLNSVLALTGANLETNTGIVADMTDGVGVLDEAFNVVSDTTQFKFDAAMATTKETLLGIGLAILEQINPYLEDFNSFMQENGPTIQGIFEDIFGAVESVALKFGELADAIMPKVVELFQDEEFQKQVANLGANLMIIADEVIKFIDSELGQFLLELTGNTVITGLQILNDQLERLAGVLFAINELMNLLSGKGPTKDFGKQIKSFEGITGIDLDDLVQGFLEQQALYFADGGIVPPRPGGTLGVVGEAGQAEAIIPLSQLDRYVGGGDGGGSKKVYNITVNAGMGANGAQLGEQIVSAIKRYERVSGPVFVSA